jgi:hypothetical protein
LITFAIVLSYVVFTVIGMVIVKYNPRFLLIIDYAILPIGLSTILFLYLFAVTYEEKRAQIVPEDVRQCVKYYGEGKSFNEIRDLMGLSSPADVKRLIEKYCAMEGAVK